MKELVIKQVPASNVYSMLTVN